MAATRKQPAKRPPVSISLDFDDLEAGDLEDIEEYSGRDDVLAILVAAQNASASAAPGTELQVMVGLLPAKVLTALLGVARRRNDPKWTPEHWRKFRFSDLAEPSANGDGADPTSAASTPASTGETSGSDPSMRTAEPSGAETG